MSLLVPSVSAGAGHVRAAQAVEAAARAATPPLDVTHLDLLALVPKEFSKLYGEQYIKLVESGYGYHSMWKNIVNYVRSVDAARLRAAIDSVASSPIGSTKTVTDNL